MSDGRYLLNDPVCINKCVKIQYNSKTCVCHLFVGNFSSFFFLFCSLTVPINNECPECAQNHVDLSEEAFLWLEPGGGTVGVATGATLTYIECP